MKSEELQREHYDTIFSEYEKHYDDVWSQQYRNEFMYGPLFRDVPLDGSQVLEAMCGSGQATQFLRDRGARITGLDISEEAIASFKQRWPGAEARCSSIFDSGFESGTFDCVVVIAGLHHVHPHVDRAVAEIARVLKPGGFFCFIEPHAGSLPDWFRTGWYKRDRRYFAENEASVDIEALAQTQQENFEVDSNVYFGGVAWLLVVNSLILRIPHRLKSIYTPALLALERSTTPLMTRRTSCMAACRWIKHR